LLAGLVEFLYLKLHQPDIDHLSSDSGDLHAVTNPHAQLTDQQEITHDREDHILQRNGDAGGNKAQEGR
jgi:hypothetical protein